MLQTRYCRRVLETPTISQVQSTPFTIIISIIIASLGTILPVDHASQQRKGGATTSVAHVPTAEEVQRALKLVEAEGLSSSSLLLLLLLLLLLVYMIKHIDVGTFLAKENVNDTSGRKKTKAKRNKRQKQQQQQQQKQKQQQQQQQKKRTPQVFKLFHCRQQFLINHFIISWIRKLRMQS
jgi:hypothetical protein